MSGYRYSPYAWRVACEASSAASARRRARLRRYAVRLNLVTFALPAAAVAAVVVL